jgi:hypothetical protein
MKQKLELSEEAIDEAIAGLSDEFAREVGVLADVFESWRRPEVAREVVESLLNRDREAFNALLEPGLDPTSGDPEVIRISLCYKLLLIAEKLGRIKVIPGTTETCRLRTDLSRDERLRYLVIASRYSDAEVWEDDAARGLSGIDSEGPVIPQGPFLDELRAEGLVKCEKDETVLSIDPFAGVFRGLKDVCGLQL